MATILQVPMKRELHRRLKKRAKDTGESMAEIARDGIEVMLDTPIIDEQPAVEDKPKGKGK